MKPVLLLTRAREDAERFSRMVQSKIGFTGEIRIVPLMRIEPIKGGLELGDAKGLIFTSRHAVEVAATKIHSRDLPAYCVGASTAEAAAAHGWLAISADGAAPELIQRILADMPEAPLAHIRGAHARGQIAEHLRAAGVPTMECVAYRQVDLPNVDFGDFEGNSPIIAPVFSPKSAKRLIRNWPKQKTISTVAFSEAVAETLQKGGLEPIGISAEPSVTSMLKTLKYQLDPV